MARIEEDHFETLQARILARLHSKDRVLVADLIKNAIIFIKRVHGQPLNDEEQTFPKHPLFPFRKRQKAQNIGDDLLYRLRTIDQYQFYKPHNIIEILTRKIPRAEDKKLSKRKAQILWQLFHNTTIPKYKLAQTLGTTPRTISKELKELEDDFAFRIFTSVDCHKFNLIVQVIYFHSKSIKHTHQLERFLINSRGFLRTFQLDQDMRHGVIVYRFPNQPDAHKMFKERLNWLQEKFFSNYHLFRVQGFYYSLSMAMYDPIKNSFSLDPEIVSEVPFSYLKLNLHTLPQPKGLQYSQPFTFDKADFILADTLYSTGPFQEPEYKRMHLKRYGINLSMKTIWKKEQRLRKEKTGCPIIHIQIPGLDDEFLFLVFCTPKATTSIRALSAFLPYVMYSNSNLGCFLDIKRPVHTSALTGQLLRKIRHEQGVSDVKLVRYQWRSQVPLLPTIVDRWNKDEQQWHIQEGDI